MVKEGKFGKLCKERMIEELASRFKERPNFFITSYMSSSSADLESLRRDLKRSSSTYVVVKNSIARIVLDKLRLKEVLDLVDGGVGISLSGDDAVAASKTLVSFAKSHGKFKIKGAMIDGALVSHDRIILLASLPPRGVLLAVLFGGMRAPISGFVNALNGVLRKFVYVVDAIKNSKEELKKT